MTPTWRAVRCGYTPHSWRPMHTGTVARRMRGVLGCRPRRKQPAELRLYPGLWSQDGTIFPHNSDLRFRPPRPLVYTYLPISPGLFGGQSPCCPSSPFSVVLYVGIRSPRRSSLSRCCHGFDLHFCGWFLKSLYFFLAQCTTRDIAMHTLTYAPGRILGAGTAPSRLVGITPSCFSRANWAIFVLRCVQM